MSWAVVWERPAERRLLEIRPWQMAESVAMAVHDFATTGFGQVERVKTDTSAPLRLRVQPYVVRFSLEQETRTLRVWAIWRGS
ncbi:MAG TPA: hypothetical protein VM925_08425 [Labilithrix sp.]|nr:hypothetical protein [Labilithrix sp.]